MKLKDLISHFEYYGYIAFLDKNSCDEFYFENLDSESSFWQNIYVYDWSVRLDGLGDLAICIYDWSDIKR